MTEAKTTSPSPPSRPGVKSFQCPNCGATVSLRGMGQTLSAVCTSCQSIIDVQNENLAILQKFNKKRTAEPAIPLGARGKIGGDYFDHIGFMIRSTSDQEYQWTEYLLFNPRIGFRWLVESGGHWSFVKMTMKIAAGENERKIKFEGETYRVFNAGKARVQYVMGEFYWKVKVGSEASTQDFIAPPKMLSREWVPESEFNWSIGEHIDAKAVSQAFDGKVTLPPVSGVGAIQPNPRVRVWKQVRNVGVLTLLLLTVEQCSLEDRGAGGVVLHEQLSYQPVEPAPTHISEPFEIKGRRSVMQLKLDAELSNNWIELDAALVEEGGQRRYEADLGTSYYSGSDSDGSWSEGSKSAEANLSGVEPGIYRLHVKAAGPKANEFPAGVSPAIQFRYSLVKDGVVRWAYYFSLLVVYLLMFIANIRKKNFEKDRWSNSDFEEST